MTWRRALRVATLVLAPLAATAGTLGAEDDHFLQTATPALGVMWLVMATTLLLRAVYEGRGVPDGRRWPWDHFDLLTATGATTLWVSAGALTLAARAGWASLSLVGVLGMGAVYLVATWNALVAGGQAAWRTARITRTIVPEIAVEGDSLREALQLSGVKIPLGMRLFATGTTTRHGVITRYAIGGEAGGAELVLERDLGAAVRGEHHAPAMTLWLADTLGLTRAPIVRRGEASFTVLPRPGLVQGARGLLGTGGDDAMARPTVQHPTEGSFRIRDYVPGDDTRRIHWVRSLQADRLVMRLPDEIPPADPALRLVLDTELDGIDELTCRAPQQLIDALVHVWLGIADDLTRSGTKVTLVAAARQGDRLAIVERNVIPRAPREMLRLGARVAWQAEIPLGALLAHSPVRQVVVSCRPRVVRDAIEPLWVMVPEPVWTSPELAVPVTSSAALAFPAGAADNRLGRRHRERLRLHRVQQDRSMFSQIVAWADWTTFPGNYIARPERGRVELAVI